MLAESTPLAHLRPDKHAFELKWDGIRAIVGLNGSLRSGAGWNMTALVPELAAVPAEGIFDGELVAFNNEGLPDFPTVCRRILQGDRTIRLTYVAFDVLEFDDEDTMRLPYRERRELLSRTSSQAHPGLQLPSSMTVRSSSIRCANVGSRGSSPNSLARPIGRGSGGSAKVKNRDY